MLYHENGWPNSEKEENSGIGISTLCMLGTFDCWLFKVILR